MAKSQKQPSWEYRYQSLRYAECTEQGNEIASLLAENQTLREIIIDLQLACEKLQTHQVRRKIH